MPIKIRIMKSRVSGCTQIICKGQKGMFSSTQQAENVYIPFLIYLLNWEVLAKPGDSMWKDLVYFKAD